MKKTLLLIAVMLTIMLGLPVGAMAAPPGAETEPEPPPPPEYSEEDIELVALVVYAEARGEGWEGKCAVAEVVYNRAESGNFGTSIKRITRRGQFARAGARVAKRGGAVYASCLEAARYAITNRTLPGNTYYFQKANRKTWRGRKTIKRYTTIYKHTFYTAGDPEAIPVFLTK